MGRRRRRGVRLEMTSLMDVMFLVLVFFIYCIFDMSVHKGLKVDLPSADGAMERGEQIVVTIASDDSMQFNGMPMTRDEIVGRFKELKGVKMDEKAMAHTEAIILSMTPKERENPEIIGASRKKRIAAGAGVRVEEVNKLLKSFEQMRKLMRQFSSPGMAKKMKRMKGLGGFGGFGGF